jgi:hypothetical protein
MADLRSRIAAIAAELAEKIVEAITSGTLEDISALTARSVGNASARLAELASESPRSRVPRPRRAKKGSRRGASGIDKNVESIVTVLKLHPEGLRSEQLQKVLGLLKHELPLAHALTKKLVRKTGNRRATRYFAS